MDTPGTMAFEVCEGDGFDLICRDCEEYLYFRAEKPAAGEPGFFSNLSLSAVVEAAKAHECKETASG